MSDSKKRYWKGIEEYKNDPEYVKYADKEFPEYLPINEKSSGDGGSRRDFLKLMGFGVAAASLAACEAPVRKAIPYLNKPVDIDPGIPNYYASTYLQGGEYSSIVVKTREGRPIKIEGNKLSGLGIGGTSSRVEASVLSLYDKERLHGPMKDGKEVSWVDLDQEVTEKLSSVVAAGGRIRLVSNTILSPATLQVIEEFKTKFAGTEHITYDTYSSSGMLKANEDAFGVRAIPSYDFSKAKTVVSIGADFLGTWISPIEYSGQYSKMRKLNRNNRKMSRHYQFETNLSLTGANADYRSTIKPSEEGQVVAALYNLIASKSGQSQVEGSASSVANLASAANDLWSSRRSSLVVTSSNDPAVQLLVNGINSMLGNYGSTLDLSRPMYYRKGDDASMNTLIDSMKAGSVGAVIFYNCNPVYNHGRGAELADGLSKTSLTVSTSDRMDETASLVGYVAPDHHFLESWNDAEPRQGSYSLGQPTISPLFNTRQGQESLMTWTGNGDTYFDYLKAFWRNNMYMESESLGFQYFWDKSLQDGVYVKELEATEQPAISADFDPASAARSIAANYGKGSGIEVMLYHKVAIGDGSEANNPWLQETPDTITKSTWDNYITVSQADATELGIANFEGKTSMANLTIGGMTIKTPIIIQPGQARGTIGLALGYGRKSAGKVADNVGIDANPFIGEMNGHSYYAITSGVSLEVLPETYQVAQTQTHETYMGRENVIQEATLEEYQKDPSAGRWKPHISTWTNDEHQLAPGEVSLWKGHKYPNHHWGLMVDMNSCTGCSACHVACQAENNIPVVGKAEVIMRREMHWMRIDRYYGSDAGADDLLGLERASENPEVTFQPMMCQHCNNASCETVCPVAATTHSTEGLNQMAYNRCIGTRYCANNCPYKVRRFNWFKYHDNDQFADNMSMNNDLGKMVLNPDVTVRSRGVMEKCSFCVQRIQAGKVTAKIEGRRTNDDDITTACASACPTDALVFGDMNNSESRISKMLQIKDYEGDGTIEKTVGEERAYTMLEEVGTKPNVLYLTKIRNKEKAEA
jgi:molybdopterin-containing oxidoreductase family iron-sulfur binding subunit